MYCGVDEADGFAEGDGEAAALAAGTVSAARTAWISPMRREALAFGVADVLALALGATEGRALVAGGELGLAAALGGAALAGAVAPGAADGEPDGVGVGTGHDSLPTSLMRGSLAEPALPQPARRTTRIARANDGRAAAARRALTA